MIETIIGFYKRSSVAPLRDLDDPQVKQELKRKRLIVFLTITFGYGFYYVCRLSLSVTKKQIADAGIFTSTELGLIGSALFFSYAAGKLTNGILADRANVRKFMATGLLVSAVINFSLGFSPALWLFFLLWGLNGWVQSFGAPSSVVTLSHWFGGKERGTFYGMWSSSHNIGEAISFVGIAVIVSSFGWAWGFRVSGIACIIMAALIFKFLYESPEVYGLKKAQAQSAKTIGGYQIEVFKNPYVWILALSSAFFYVTRYAINSWGIFFLEAEKGYTMLEASSIVSINAIAGIAGTFFSGFISDKFFAGKRNVPALLFGILYVFAIALFVLGDRNPYIDSFSMILFGLALGVLLVYLGGLMAVDICSKEASGTALGVVGIASYIGAGLQDMISGYLINNKAGEQEIPVYDFELAGYFWIGSAMASAILATLVWKARPRD